MGSAMLEQVEILAFDLDRDDAQDKLVRIHGRLMTVEELREALVPKTRKVRTEAVTWRNLYRAIADGDAVRTKELFDELAAVLGEGGVLGRLQAKHLLDEYYEMMRGSE